MGQCTDVYSHTFLNVLFIFNTYFINSLGISYIILWSSLLPPSTSPRATPIHSHPTCSHFLKTSTVWLMLTVYSWLYGHPVADLLGTSPIKKAISLLSWQLSIADNSSAKGRTLCPPPSLHAVFFSPWAFTVLCTHPQMLWVHRCSYHLLAIIQHPRLLQSFTLIQLLGIQHCS